MSDTVDYVFAHISVYKQRRFGVLYYPVLVEAFGSFVP